MQAGARKVYAVEASGMVKYARQLVAASGQAPHNPLLLACPDCVSIQLLNCRVCIYQVCGISLPRLRSESVLHAHTKLTD